MGRIEYDLNMLLLWHLSEENKNADSKRFMQPHVHYSTVYTSQDMETTKVSVNG